VTLALGQRPRRSGAMIAAALTVLLIDLGIGYGHEGGGADAAPGVRVVLEIDPFLWMSPSGGNFYCRLKALLSWPLRRFRRLQR
jgi:hypothetical protein